MLKEDIESMLDWAEYTSGCSCKIEENWIRMITETKAVWSINIEDYRRFRIYTLFTSIGKTSIKIQNRNPICVSAPKIKNKTSYDIIKIICLC